MYELWGLLKSIISRKEAEGIKIKNILKNNLIIISFFLLFSLFYFLNLFLQGISIINTILYYYNTYSVNVNNYSSSQNFQLYNLQLLNVQNVNITRAFFNFLEYLIKSFQNNNLKYLTFILFIAFFLNLKKKNKLSSFYIKIISFLLFSLLVTFITFVIVGFLYKFKISFIIPVTFLVRFIPRLFELFQGFWAILFCLVIREFITFLNHKVSQYKEGKNQKSVNLKEYKVITFSILLGLGLYLYISHLDEHYTYFYYSYYNDKDLDDVFLYSGDYFNRVYGSKTNEINLMLFDNIAPKNMFSLISIYRYLVINSSIFYTYGTNFTTISEMIILNEINYSITPKFNITVSALLQIRGNYSVLYENNKYIFFKI